MKKLITACSLGALLLLPQCYVVQQGHPGATYFVNYSAAGVSANGAVAPTDREGEACATAYGIPLLGLTFGFGDASIEAAARKSGIQNITSVSHKLSFSTFMQDWCTVITGN